MESNYAEAITLADLSKVSGLNKYTLLRSFTMQRGITPYQYLSTIRVNTLGRKSIANGSGVAIRIYRSKPFYKVFKNFMGLTSKLYQNIFASDNEQTANVEMK